MSDVGRRARTAWQDGGPRQRLLIGLGCVMAAALVGAFLFGAWHVLYGGFVKGNWRAGGFGVVLAAGAGALLVGERGVIRRLGRPTDPTS